MSQPAPKPAAAADSAGQPGYSSKTNVGRFFEDFPLGAEIVHALPRTATAADASLYLALTGNRFAVTASETAARALGHRTMPLDDILVFHLVFGKSVPDISLNAVANLGYADCRFLAPVYPGATIEARSTVIGLKENTDGATGIVYVETRGSADGIPVLAYKRWVMVRRRTSGALGLAPSVPELPASVPPDALVVPAWLKPGTLSPQITGERHRFGDYQVGERIDHRDGITIEEAEHMMATRLYHNTARVHFDQVLAQEGRFGRRLIYGGHIISLARALTLNGLANAQHMLAINGGRHVAPTFAGDTIFAWTEVKACMPLPGRDDCGALRLRTVAIKNQPATDFPEKDGDGKPHPSVVLDFDYTVMMPR